jgi:F-type H+-transporting ATPase subunit delta
LGLKGSSGVVARRYARALLDVVGASPAADPEAPALMRAALSEASLLLEKQPDLLAALTHPAVAVEARQRVATAVWAKAPATFTRLIHLLVERDRVRLLPTIAEAYADAWNEARGVLSAKAVSAVELQPAQREALSAALQKATGKGIELEARVDGAVLGGVRVTLGGRTFDGTVKTQLGALKRKLRGAA